MIETRKDHCVPCLIARRKIQQEIPAVFDVIPGNLAAVSRCGFGQFNHLEFAFRLVRAAIIQCDIPILQFPFVSNGDRQILSRRMRIGLIAIFF